MSYSQMRTAMSTFVNQTTTVMKSNDVLPAWVQIGTEINRGICRPVGSVSNAAQLTGLLNAAYTQVKAVSPNSTVCVHLAQPQKYDVMTTFFSRYAANGGKWDMSPAPSPWPPSANCSAFRRTAVTISGPGHARR